MARKDAAIIINTIPIVRVIDGGKKVDLTLKDFEISQNSGKNPFSRVFKINNTEIVVPKNWGTVE